MHLVKICYCDITSFHFIYFLFDIVISNISNKIYLAWMIQLVSIRDYLHTA